MDLAKTAASVLDLGCGTGALAAALGRGREVIGVDPAATMLDIARQRPGGNTVTWVEGDARTVRLGRRFDLVLLTGHTFQVFLTKEDQAAVLAAIAAHLNPDGRFVLDSRNPTQKMWDKWAARQPVRSFEHPDFGLVECWSASTRDADADIVTYVNSYKVVATGKTYSASTQIQFPSKERLAGQISGAGLSVDQWLGDWRGVAFHPDADEIIPLGRLTGHA